MVPALCSEQEQQHDQDGRAGDAGISHYVRLVDARVEREREGDRRAAIQGPIPDQYLGEARPGRAGRPDDRDVSGDPGEHRARQQEQKPAGPSRKCQHEARQKRGQAAAREPIRPEACQDERQRHDQAARQVERGPGEHPSQAHELSRKQEQEIMVAEVERRAERKMRWHVTGRHQ